MTSSAPVWLITGSSSGFGLALTLLALQHGHHVIATSRNPSKTPSLVSQIESLGSVWHTLDVSSPEPVLKTGIEKAISVWGRIDILVNNAGYALLGAFETLTDEQTISQLTTNLLGPMRLTRLLLPFMRARGSGTIVNISSTAGIEARPTRTLYSASKFGLEAFSEALAAEVKPLGIRVLIVEPGAFRSNFSATVEWGERELPGEYEGTEVGRMMELMRGLSSGGSPGSIPKGAQAIFDVVTKTGQAEGIEEFLRLPLGKDGTARWGIKLANLRANLDGTEKIWKNTDVDG